MKKLLVLSLLVLSIVACDEAARPKNTKRSESIAVLNYGDGVYYFSNRGSKFGRDLAAFLSSHDCKVEGMVGNGTGPYGTDLGYFVICR